MNGKIRITPGNVPSGQQSIKAVAYDRNGFTVIVPDPLGNGIGDLSHLPSGKKNTLTQYSQNGFTRRPYVINPNTSHGKMVANSLQNQGYWLEKRKITFNEEFDSKGSRLS